MQGLRFLKLLDGDKPTPALDTLAHADVEARKGLLDRMLRNAYGNAIVDALRTDTPKMFDSRLSSLGTTSTTHRKAASFLINIAKIAGLDIQPAITKRARIRRAAGTGKRVKASQSRVDNADEKTGASAADEKVFDLHPSLQALLEDLERIGPTWYDSDKARWLGTFQAVLDYAYPVNDEGAAAAEDAVQQLPLTQPAS